MLTCDINNQIDRIWDAFSSGGISNPLEIIKQLTYLLFLRRLDDLHMENKSARLKRPIDGRVFPEGKDTNGRGYDDLRWSRFKHFALVESSPCPTRSGPVNADFPARVHARD